ncbi:hypothetical protein L506_0395 [Bordetella bronchiseptica GA96-01]|nr:hypothetical protein L506_0395 [Bordetella bronchiseptica GA96-01]
MRERVSMPVDLVKPALEGLRATFGGAVREAAILSEPYASERGASTARD